MLRCLNAYHLNISIKDNKVHKKTSQFTHANKNNNGNKLNINKLFTTRQACETTTEATTF